MAQRSMYGGEAVFDGVMMRGARFWSLAVRREDGSITVKVKPVAKWTMSARRFPLLRGPVALAASVVLGSRALQDSLAIRDNKPSTMTIGHRIATVLSAFLIVALFLLIPLGIARLVTDQQGNPLLFSTIESVLRIVLLFAYLGLLSLADDVKKVFEYHGAEHQTIAAQEAGEELTVENVRAHSRRHPRCGTAFLLLIFVIGTVAHALVGNHSFLILLASRIVLVPLIAGIVYEFLRASSNHLESRWAKILAAPGLTLQRLTTRPASDAQIEVAIAALEAVVTADVLAEDEYKIAVTAA